MKILTLKYNRTASAICTSTLMTNEAYACKDIYKLSSRPPHQEHTFQTEPKKKNQEYAISGTWQ